MEDRATLKRDSRLKAKAVERSKEDCDGSHFLRLPHVVIDSPGYRLAEHSSRSLLVDVASQLRRPGSDGGLPNGALLATRDRMAAFGWKSQGVLHRAIADLVSCGLLIETRKGHKNSASLYAVSWMALDIDGSKHVLDIDSRAWARVHRGAYLRPSKVARARSKRKAFAPFNGQQGDAIAPLKSATNSVEASNAPLKGAMNADFLAPVAPFKRPSIEHCHQVAAVPGVHGESELTVGKRGRLTG
jgi:hypothetical protein